MLLWWLLLCQRKEISSDGVINDEIAEEDEIIATKSSEVFEVTMNSNCNSKISLDTMRGVVSPYEDWWICVDDPKINTQFVDLKFILSHLVDSRYVSYTHVQVIKDNLANKVEAKSEADSPSGETDRKASKKTSQFFALFYLIVWIYR